MSEDETLIENSISRLGMRTLDVMRYGKPASLNPWLGMVPGEAREHVVIFRRVEPILNMHHMLVTWNAREMVEYVDCPIRFGALWWIGYPSRTTSSGAQNSREGTMSYAIDMAASLFKLRTGRYPTKCWVRELPKEAPDEYTIEGFSNDPPTKPIVLRMASWVPERFVCVGIELTEAEIEFKDGKYAFKE